MRAEDIMTRDVITVNPSIKIKSLAKLLIDNQISGAPVVTKGGKILGIVSEGDIVLTKGKDAKTIMSKKVISIRRDTTAEEIARLMVTHAIRRLPVMEDGKLVGIVSRADIVHAIALGEHTAIAAPIYDL